MARAIFKLPGERACALMVLLSAALLAACSPSGKASRSSDLPTFVSLNPCLDAILVELAEPDQILALSHYSSDPSSSSIDAQVAAQFGVTGGTVEEVIALEPDIVLASTFIAPSTRAAFERLGVKVETFGSPATVDESLTQIREIAALAGHDADGEALVETIASGSSHDHGKPLSALLWQPGQIVPGEATLVSEHLRWAGFTSHAATQGLGQADYVSLEHLLSDPPDVVLVAGSARGQRHPLLADLKGTQVADFPPNLLFCGGPTILRARAHLLKIRERFEREYGQGSRP